MSVIDDLLTMAKAAKLNPSWRDKMSPAKFRGASFFVDTSERSGGRRTAKHEYPFKDEPYLEDLGRKAREFRIDGYVLGAEYFALRDKLLDALEAEGPAELVHPYHGKKKCIVTDFTVKETRLEGGIAQFSIEFSETPAQPVQPTSGPDTKGALSDSAVNALAAARAEFVSAYSTASSITGSITGAIISATQAVKNVSRTILGPLRRGQQESAILLARINAIETSVESLVRAPGEMFDGMADIFARIADRKALRKVYSFNPGSRPPATTRSRLLERANFDATQAMVCRLAVINAALAAVDEAFDSYDAAVDARNELTELLDDQSESANDETYPTLLQLRADLVKAIPGDDGELARLIEYTPPATVPSLVAAYQLYGDVTSESDIVTRNRIQHPGFIRGGTVLEVLSRG